MERSDRWVIVKAELSFLKHSKISLIAGRLVESAVV